MSDKKPPPRYLNSLNSMELVLLYAPSLHHTDLKRSRSQLQLGNNFIIHSLRPSYYKTIGGNKLKVENIHTTEDEDQMFPIYAPVRILLLFFFFEFC